MSPAVLRPRLFVFDVYFLCSEMLLLAPDNVAQTNYGIRILRIMIKRINKEKKEEDLYRASLPHGGELNALDEM